MDSYVDKAHKERVGYFNSYLYKIEHRENQKKLASMIAKWDVRKIELLIKQWLSNVRQ